MKHLYNLIKVANKIDINIEINNNIDKFRVLAKSKTREVAIPCADFVRNLERFLQSNDKKFKYDVALYILNRIPLVQEKSEDNVEIGTLG